MAGDQPDAEDPDRVAGPLDLALRAASRQQPRVFSYEHAGLEQLHSINYAAATCATSHRCRPAASTR
jgi:hypothetical protein